MFDRNSCTCICVYMYCSFFDFKENAVGELAARLANDARRCVSVLLSIFTNTCSFIVIVYLLYTIHIVYYIYTYLHIVYIYIYSILNIY